jgi:serine protease Do
MRKLPTWSIVMSLFAAVLHAHACTSSTPSANQADASAPHRSSGGEPPEDTTATAPAVDFRRQFVVAAQVIRPAVVSINSSAKLQAGAGGSPFEGTPFEHFFERPFQGAPQLRRGVGSGTILDTAGHILTNHHVIADAIEVTVVLANDRKLEAKVIGSDPKTDIAVIKIDPGDAELQAAKLGDSETLEVGDWVIACGSPFGLTQTVSAGIVSALGRGHVGITEYEDFIQTDAAINPGNSGGPLVDLSGRVVGINTAIASASGGNAGVGFAIPIELAAQVKQQLIEHGKVVRGYVGVLISDVREGMAESFGFERAGGALVQDVEPDGPGAKAGLKPGDIIFERDGKGVVDSSDFRNGVAASKPGTTMELQVWREKKAIRVTVKLGEMPGSGGTTSTGKPADHARWGLALSDLPSEPRRKGGQQKGALIGRVAPGSPADDAGVQVGDVLVSVGGAEVEDAAAALPLLRAAKSPVRIRVVRDGRGLFLMMSAD